MTERQHGTASLMARMRENWSEAATPEMAANVTIQRLARLLQESARESLATFELAPSEFEVLAALRSHAPPHRLTPSDLYDALLISSGGLTKILKALEVRALIRRPPSETDGRSRPVELSAEGRGLAERAMAAVQRAEAPMLRDLAEDSAGGLHLTRALDELLVSVEAAARHSPH